MEGVAGGKVGGVGPARDVGVARRVHGNAVPIIIVAAAQVGRVAKCGVNHQRLAAVVGPDLESDAVVGEEDIMAVKQLSIAD